MKFSTNVFKMSLCRLGLEEGFLGRNFKIVNCKTTALQQLVCILEQIIQLDIYFVVEVAENVNSIQQYLSQF